MYAPKLQPSVAPNLQSFQLDIKINKYKNIQNIQNIQNNKEFKINYGKTSLSSNGRG